jgi:hypothetical protein
MGTFRWIAEHIIAPVVVIAVVGVGGLTCSLQYENWEQTKQIELSVQRADYQGQAIADLKSELNRKLERLEDKMDRVLERLGGP